MYLRQVLGVIQDAFWHGPVLNAVLTFVGAILLGFFSMGLKKWFCHKTEFMTRRKRIIDELANVFLGLVLFCGVLALQFVMQAGVIHDAGREIQLVKEPLWLWIRLVLLTTASLALF